MCAGGEHLLDCLFQLDSFHGHISSAGFAYDANLRAHANDTKNVPAAWVLFLELDPIVWLKLDNGWHTRFHPPFGSLNGVFLTVAYIIT